MAVSVLVATASAVHAEAWMVKSSTFGCKDRGTLAALDAAGRPTDPALPEDCVGLDAGERLLDRPQAGGGFDAYVQLERRDASLVFVRRSDVVPDPGVGSVYEDR